MNYEKEEKRKKESLSRKEFHKELGNVSSKFICSHAHECDKECPHNEEHDKFKGHSFFRCGERMCDDNLVECIPAVTKEMKERWIDEDIERIKNGE